MGDDTSSSDAVTLAVPDGAACSSLAELVTVAEAEASSSPTLSLAVDDRVGEGEAWLSAVVTPALTEPVSDAVAEGVGSSSPVDPVMVAEAEASTPVGPTGASELIGDGVADSSPIDWLAVSEAEESPLAVALAVS